MNEETKQILNHTFVALLAVTVSGLITYLLTPDNRTGQIIRFAVPLVVGLAGGAWVHIKAREILDFEELLEDS